MSSAAGSETRAERWRRKVIWRMLRACRVIARRFDGNDAHFYAGMGMLFCGLWLTASLGLALAVCGGIVAAVGFVSALVGVFTAGGGVGDPRRTDPRRTDARRTSDGKR